LPGVAVKVTGVPLQILFVLETIVTVAGVFWKIDVVMVSVKDVETPSILNFTVPNAPAWTALKL
jgi:hypothetical protein